MSINTDPTPCARPQIVTRTIAGLLVSHCLTCRRSSQPTDHRPKAERWAHDHRRTGA